MLDFSPTEEQEEIRRLAHSIALEQLRPQGRDAEKRGDISPELMQTIAQTGLTTPFPEWYGGSGDVEAVTYVMIAEELGFGDGALALNIIDSMMGPLTVALAGNKRQQEQYVAPFCDVRTGHNQRGSLAFAERTGGYTLAEISATLRQDGQGYVLNGTKRAVIHGANSSPRIVLARLEGTEGPDGLCGVVLPEQQAGVRISPDVLKLGLIAAPSAAYTLTEAVVPESSLLGEPGNIGVVRAATLSLLLRAGVACGSARAALEYASNYARERIAFGRPIVSYQGIAFMISEMAMRLDGMRLLLWSAAASWDRGVEAQQLVRDAEAAHYQAVKLAKSATIDAVQILGGAGFLQDHPAEMWIRNAAAMD